MFLLDRVRRTIRAHDLAQPSTRVVVALSGGSDSVALAALLTELAAAGDLQLAGAAHFNHRLRAAADADERACAALAARLNLPYCSDDADVARRAKAERRSLEAAGRAARYDFLERARQRFRADVIALGHTRDDQAETFLLRLLRGAGVRGLAGMHPRNGAFIRPVLDCRRSELRDYLAARGLPFVRDESNDDVSIPRNRVRAELLPLLERRFNPSIVDALAAEAEIARDEWRWMAEASADAAAQSCRRTESGWAIDAKSVSDLPRALARMVVRTALVEAAGETPVSFRHVEDVLRLAREGGPPIDGPGQRMERIGAAVVLTNKPPAPVNLFSYPLSIPGEVTLGEAGWVVTAETARSASDAGWPSAADRQTRGHNATAVVALEKCNGPLRVRNRRTGDRFRPLGLRGRKKLQDYFVDRKIARQRRDLVPIVVDAADRIVWVAGHSIDDEFRVTDPAQAVLILRLRRA
jgi:tRNA(Ile)-lysidine synthase